MASMFAKIGHQFHHPGCLVMICLAKEQFMGLCFLTKPCDHQMSDDIKITWLCDNQRFGVSFGMKVKASAGMKVRVSIFT